MPNKHERPNGEGTGRTEVPKEKVKTQFATKGCHPRKASGYGESFDKAPFPTYWCKTVQNSRPTLNTAYDRPREGV